MTKSLHNLIGDLEQRSELFGIEKPFLHYGEDAFDKLYALVKSENSSWPSVRNAMYILFMLARERFPEKFKFLVEPTLKLSKSNCEELRSCASQDLVRLSILADKFPHLDIAVPDRVRLCELLQEALSLGLKKEAMEYVKAFIDQNNRELDSE